MHVTIAHRLILKDVPEVLIAEIRKRLTLLNPKWVDNNKMGRSNYKVEQHLKFYTVRKDGTVLVPRGWGNHLARLCQVHDEQVTYEDLRRELDPVDFSFQGELKPFQETAVQTMCSKYFGTLSAPTGAGKTVCGLALIARRRQPALVVVHTKELMNQWVEQIEHFLGIPAREVGRIGGGKMSVGDRITVATVQTLYKCAEEVAPNIGHIVVDECHRAPSRTFTEAVTKFDCKYSLGLSATPWRRDRLSQLIFWFLGDMLHQVDKEDLLDSGHILRPEIFFRPTEFRTTLDPSEEYPRMLAELVDDPGRNQRIVRDVAEEVRSGTGVALVLSDRKGHCHHLRDLLAREYGVEAELLTGELSIPEREAVVRKLKTDQARVLVATGQLIGEGFDCDAFTSLFFATPVRFSGRVLQYLGRVLRPGQDTRRPRVYDYVDVHVGPLEAGAKARKRTYEETYSISREDVHEWE
ncbi:MAG TPA: DEAD/DEAH box helicase [Desulfomicrobiaceae bacterium]|nr:DEAD/DEAH box helicase [Desulfomicrobiaceae bacterium]